MNANTPPPPYYAVIFSSVRTEDGNGYAETADHLVELAKDQDGYPGIESARNELGITVSYWRDLESIRKWKANADHKMAQAKGRSDWYKAYKTRIALVERDYEF